MAGGVINNLDGTTFWKGYIYGSIQTGGETPKGIRFGALQNVNISHSFAVAELRGPESLSPVGVGITSEEVSGTAEFASIFASQARMLTGAAVTQVGGNTRVRKLVETEPVPFDLHLESPDGGANIQVDLYNCLNNGAYQIMRADTRAWIMSNFGFKAYGRNVGGERVLFDITLPGNQTDSATGAGTPIQIS